MERQFVQYQQLLRSRDKGSEKPHKAAPCQLAAEQQKAADKERRRVIKAQNAQAKALKHQAQEDDKRAIKEERCENFARMQA